jgi:xanthine dehydrogenase accessory protein XdhC
MLVTPTAFTGTIGGGRLEWDAIAAARQSLAAGETARELRIPLGPEIGQCCGGRVTLSIVRQNDDAKAAEADALAAGDRATRHAIVFGAGHVGIALARALSPLPLTVRLVDSRPDAFAGLAIEGVEFVASERVTEQVDAAPAGSAFVVLTHSHALDSLIVAAALERGDFSYLGLIGSRTKRRLFEKAFRETGIAEERIARIVCPIGSPRVKDKRPAVIAALVAAEIIEAQAAGAVAQTARQKREAA